MRRRGLGTAPAMLTLGIVRKFLILRMFFE